jgi:hypothetical protein
MMDGAAFGSAIISGMIAIGIAGAAVVGLIWGIVEWTTDDAIRVREPLTPRIELIVEDNIVDTVYVYDFVD